MATLWTRWLLSTLLVSVSNGFALAGPPARPSPPYCYIPCDENNCSVDIHCSWDEKQDPQFPANYSLHWEPANSEERHVISGTSLSVIIQRKHFSNHENVRIWVQAENQHGFAKSQDKVFNTAEIFKPLPPHVTESYQDPLEIHWTSTCGQLHLSLGTCDVRHRTEGDKVWLEDEDEFQASYTFYNPLPCTVYEYQVRCACESSLKSNWSAVQSKLSTESAPVGELDVWRACGMSPASFDCALAWKKLSTSQACGHILGYEVRLSYNNGTAVLVNLSTTKPSDQLVCDEMQCHINSSLKDVVSVSVSAYNAHGATVPSNLTMPMPELTKQVKEKNHQAVHLKINEENLTVSWDLPSQLSDKVKEYVVQYKAECPPGKGFDWVKVSKSQTTGTFTGQFQNHTPYKVSLFAVSHNNEVDHLSSVVGYSLQRTPSRVPSFNVVSIAATHVSLLWEPVPLCQRNGVILYYQIGVDRQNVYNVSASPQHENKTFELLHLSPGQDYEVWIRAVTVAGPGENVTTGFQTNHLGGFAYLMPLLLLGILFLVVIYLLNLPRGCRGESKVCLLVPSCFYEKVPDPRNSHIFKQMKHQINDPFAWVCIPVNEPHPKISQLEVLEILPCASKSSLEKMSDPDRSTGPVLGDTCSQIDCHDDQREDAFTDKCQNTEQRRKAYSKMIDSDEEEVREDCWSSSDEEPHESGYEKHFMPTASEILV